MTSERRGGQDGRHARWSSHCRKKWTPNTGSRAGQRLWRWSDLDPALGAAGFQQLWIITQSRVRCTKPHLHVTWKMPSFTDAFRIGMICYKLYLKLDHALMRPTTINALTAKLSNWNFHLLEVVSRWRDPQPQVSENYSDLTEWRSAILTSCRLTSRFICNMFKRWYLMC